MRFFHRFTQGELRLSRIEAFSDGVFAVAVTLLVLDLKVPALTDHAGVGELARALLDQLPKFVSWLISFIIVCKFWLKQSPAHLRCCSLPFRAIDARPIRPLESRLQAARTGALAVLHGAATSRWRRNRSGVGPVRRWRSPREPGFRESEALHFPTEGR